MVKIYKIYKKLLNNLYLSPIEKKNNISFYDWFKLEDEIEKNIKFINYIPLILISFKSIKYVFKFYNNNLDEIINFYYKKSIHENIPTKEKIKVFVDFIYFNKNNSELLIEIFEKFLKHNAINDKLKRKIIIYLFDKYEFKRILKKQEIILKNKNLRKNILELLIKNYRIFLNSSKKDIEYYIYILLKLNIDYKNIKQIIKKLNINQSKSFSSFLLEKILLLKPNIKIFQFLFNYFNFNKLQFNNWHYLVIILNERNLNKKIYKEYIKNSNKIFNFLIKTQVFEIYLKENLESFFSISLSYFNFEITNYLINKYSKNLLLFNIQNKYIFENLFNNLIYENLIENKNFLNNEYILNNLNNYILFIISNPNFKKLKYINQQKITHYLLNKPFLFIIFNEKFNLIENLKKYDFEFDLNININKTNPLYLFLTSKIFYNVKKKKEIQILQKKHKDYLKFLLDNYYINFEIIYNFKKYPLESINNYLIDILLNKIIKLINNPSIDYEEKTPMIKFVKKLYLVKKDNNE